MAHMVITECGALTSGEPQSLESDWMLDMPHPYSQMRESLKTRTVRV